MLNSRLLIFKSRLDGGNSGVCLVSSPARIVTSWGALKGWANEERFWASAILDLASDRYAWCVLIRTESKIGRNFGAAAGGSSFSVLLLFCRELRLLLFLKALCVYDDEKSLWSSSSLELLLFHFLASRKLLSHAETLIKEREKTPFCSRKLIHCFDGIFVFQKTPAAFRKALESIF